MVHVARVSGPARSHWDTRGRVKAAWVKKGINTGCGGWLLFCRNREEIWIRVASPQGRGTDSPRGFLGFFYFVF